MGQFLAYLHQTFARDSSYSTSKVRSGGGLNRAPPYPQPITKEKQMQLVSRNENRDFSKLLRLIKNPPQGSLEFEFTPEIAEYVLSKLNLHNRPKKPVKIVQYAKDMQDKNWSITGETLKFGTDGLLKDGQNRLAACIRAQTPFRSQASSQESKKK